MLEFLTGLLGLVLGLLIGAVLRPTLDGLTDWSRVRFKQHGVRLDAERNLALSRVYSPSATTRYYFESEGPVSDPPAQLDDWWHWAHSQGGEDVSVTAVVLTVQSTADVTVVVDPPQVLVASREIRHGIIRTPEGLGGGQVVPRRFYIELRGEGQIEGRFLDEAENEVEHPSFKMARGDTERIEVFAFARDDRRYEWRLVVPMIVNGHKVDIRVNEKSPYVTIGPEGIPKTLMWVDDSAMGGERGWFEPGAAG